MQAHVFTEAMPLTAVARVQWDDPHLFFRMHADDDVKVGLGGGKGYESLLPYKVGTHGSWDVYALSLDWMQCVSEARWNDSDDETQFEGKEVPTGSRKYVVRFVGRIFKWAFETDVVNNVDYHDPKAWGKQEPTWEATVRKRYEIEPALHPEHTRWIGTSCGDDGEPVEDPPAPVETRFRRWCVIA